MIEPVPGHEKQVRHVEKGRHAAGGTMLVRLRCRRQQHVDRRRELRRQVVMQCLGYLKPATGERQCSVTRERIAQKRIVRKLGVHGANHAGDGAWRARAKLLLELARHARSY